MLVNEIAKRTGIPASTIREYEIYGLIAPSERLSNGYRVFEPYHIPQLNIARLCFRKYLNRRQRQLTSKIIAYSAAFDFSALFPAIREYISAIDDELRLAYEAADILGRFIAIDFPDTPQYTRTEAARIASVSYDTVRSWERNGLIGTDADSYARKRLSKADLERIKLIRFLQNTGYSLVAIGSGLHSTDPNKGSSLLIDPAVKEEWLEGRDRWVRCLQDAKTDAESIHVNAAQLYNLSTIHHI